jgi:hypothetical protein
MKNTITNNMAESLMELFTRRCGRGLSSTITVDQEMFPLLGVATGGITAEKAYSIAKKRVKQVGAVLDKDPKELTFQTTGAHFLDACLKFGPTELRMAVFDVISRYLVDNNMRRTIVVSSDNEEMPSEASAEEAENSEQLCAAPNATVNSVAAVPQAPRPVGVVRSSDAPSFLYDM